MTDDDDWIGPWPAGALPVTSNHWPSTKGPHPMTDPKDDELVRQLRAFSAEWGDGRPNIFETAAARIAALSAERDAAVAQVADLEMRLHVMDHEQSRTELLQGIEIAALRERETWRPGCCAFCGEPMFPPGRTASGEIKCNNTMWWHTRCEPAPPPEPAA